MRLAKGFTLLEVVVVLVLVGIVSSLAIPGLQRMYDSMSVALERDELISHLNALALRVRSDGRDRFFVGFNSQETHALKSLPDDFEAYLLSSQWEILVPEPLLITAAGFCPKGARLVVSRLGREFELYLRSPDCQVVL